jgi:hypothetical protein
MEGTWSWLKIGSGPVAGSDVSVEPLGAATRDLTCLSTWLNRKTFKIGTKVSMHLL